MRDFTDMGRMLVVCGLGLAALGGALMLFRRVPRLPGDILIQREGFQFYMPLGWCVVLSLALSGIAWAWGKLR